MAYRSELTGWTRSWQNFSPKADSRIRRPPKRSLIGWKKIIIIFRHQPDGSIKASFLRSIGSLLKTKKVKPNRDEEVKMEREKKVNDFVSRFKELSKEEQKEVMKELIPEFCQTAMGDQSFIQEMMPRCMEMMKGTDFPMKEMMSKMMGRV